MQRENAKTRKFEKSVRARCAQRKRENAKIRKVEKTKMYEKTRKVENSKVRIRQLSMFDATSRV